VSETKKLKKCYGAKRESSRQFWKLSPVRAALLSARMAHLADSRYDAHRRYRNMHAREPEPLRIDHGPHGARHLHGRREGSFGLGLGLQTADVIRESSHGLGLRLELGLGSATCG